MSVLKNNNITLRALEPEDLDFLFSTENDDAFWEVSNTQTPFSKYLLKQYLENSHLDIYQAKQLRLVIVNSSTQDTIGLVDLFNYNPQHKRAGIGILILKNYQRKGFAGEALKLFISYTFTHLDIHQLYANIPVDNKNSISLFEKMKFEKIGIKKDWIFNNGIYKDVLQLQLINSK